MENERSEETKIPNPIPHNSTSFTISDHPNTTAHTSYSTTSHHNLTNINIVTPNTNYDPDIVRSLAGTNVIYTPSDSLLANPSHSTTNKVDLCHNNDIFDHLYPPLSPNTFATTILNAALPKSDEIDGDTNNNHNHETTRVSLHSHNIGPVKDISNRNSNIYEDQSTASLRMGNTSSSTESMDVYSQSPVPSSSTQDSCMNQDTQSPSQSRQSNGKKSVIFDTVTVYHFTRTQGFSSIPTQGGSTLGMKRRHFFRRKLSVDLYEEVRRRSRREILLKIKFDKHKRKADDEDPPSNCNSSSSSSSKTESSDSDEDSFSDLSDISDSELENDSYIFLQPVGVKLRRSLLRASGVGRIDPKEKRECKTIRESRERTGCKCVNQCVPGLCECSRLGVNCHVDRVSFPCGCVSEGCKNPEGRTEFDVKRVKGHLIDTLFKSEDEDT